MAPATKTRSKKIKDEAQCVTVIGTCGTLPIIPDDTEWINPTTSRKVPGVTLTLGDNGAAVLDPTDEKDKRVLDVLLPWLEDGTDERIASHAIQVVPMSRLQAPYPLWDSHAPDACLARVVELGLDPEVCLRYELQAQGRKALVAKLEDLVDTAPEEDPLSVPEL